MQQPLLTGHDNRNPTSPDYRSVTMYQRTSYRLAQNCCIQFRMPHDGASKTRWSHLYFYICLTLNTGPWGIHRVAAELLKLRLLTCSPEQKQTWWHEIHSSVADGLPKNSGRPLWMIFGPRSPSSLLYRRVRSVACIFSSFAWWLAQ